MDTVDTESDVAYATRQPSKMKLSMITASVALSAVATFFVACTRESKPKAQTPGVVAFAGAGVSLKVGEGWTRIDMSPGLPICPPTLISKHGIVRAMLFASDRSDVPKAATSLRGAFDSNTEAVKDSFRQEEFTTESGLHGIHLSYAQRSPKSGDVIETRSHNYIITNRENRCVSISYIATATSDSDAVHQMVRKSLRLESPTRANRLHRPCPPPGPPA